MKQEELKGQWRELKGQIQQRWAKLSDDDLERISGKTEELAGKLQERYGKSKQWAEEQINDFKAASSD